MPPELTDDQKTLVGTHGSLFAEACPGAGKTRAIAARFLKRTAEEPRRGIALLSFTNAAVDEAKIRCAGQPKALQAPHFVGTFDSFINRFITRPLYVRYYQQTPRFVASWAGLPTASFRLKDVERVPNFELDWFEFDSKLRAKPPNIPPAQAGLLEPVVAGHQQELLERASRLCRGLVARGLLSASASRALAAYYLGRDETAELIGRLLALRFTEVIVDEAQDCGPEELMVLELLRRFKVAIVAVADPDQAIFEFRRADPKGLRNFAATLGPSLSLDGNFRSTPAICALNTSLRQSKRAEKPEGKHKSLTTPVQIVGFRSSKGLRGRVEQLIARHGLASADVIFVAHRTSDARNHAGAHEMPVRTANPVLRIAWAHSAIRSAASSGRQRLRAIELVERILRRVARAEGDSGDLGLESVDERWLREAAIRLATSLDPAGLTAGQYAERVRQHLQQVEWPSGVGLIDRLGSIMRAPKPAEWQTSDRDPGLFKWATIHSVKGQEFPGVVVVLPSGLLKGKDDSLHAIDHWERQTGSEYRRVLYVGASRAQKLLILAVHRNHLQRVINLMERDGVPYELHH